ncbi:MAG TPA: hypothetical protein EYM28_00445 [Rhodospirillales bacterium]|nr:hypothetical protein [Dehalococcoidia bacterium]HIM19047.1 hypothetical protein [Rhodospirillales bacterium]
MSSGNSAPATGAESSGWTITMSESSPTAVGDSPGGLSNRYTYLSDLDNFEPIPCALIGRLLEI